MKRNVTDLTPAEHEALKRSGMLWEFYPEATGNPWVDLYNSDTNDSECKDDPTDV